MLSATSCSAPSPPPGSGQSKIAGKNDTPSSASYKKALDAYKRNNLDTAEQGFFEAAKLAKSEGPESDVNYKNAIRHLYWVYQDRAKYAEARKMLARLDGWSAEQQMKFKTAQLIAYAHTSKYDSDDLSAVEKREAVKFCRVGLGALQPFLGHVDPGLVKLYAILSRVSLSDDDYSDAEEALIQIKVIREQTAGTDSLAYADASMQLAKVYLNWCKELLSKDGGFANPAELLTEASASLTAAEKVYSTLLESKDERLAQLKEQQKLCADLQAKSTALTGESSKSVKVTPGGELPPFEP